jgi:hypothetical protein
MNENTGVVGQDANLATIFEDVCLKISLYEEGTLLPGSSLSRLHHLSYVTPII